MRVLSEEVARLRIRSVGSQEDSEGAGRYFELLRLVDAIGDKAIREGISNCVREMRALLAKYHSLTAEEQN